MKMKSCRRIPGEFCLITNDARQKKKEAHT